MRAANLISEVRRQIRGVKNIADADILARLNQEAKLASLDLNIPDKTYTVSYSSGTGYIELTSYRGDAIKSVAFSYLNEYHPVVIVSSDYDTRHHTDRSAVSGFTRPVYAVLREETAPARLYPYPNISGTYIIELSTTSTDMDYASEPWGGAFKDYHMMLAYNVAAIILTEEALTDRAKVALSNYQRMKNSLYRTRPPSIANIKSPMRNAFLVEEIQHDY